MKDEDCKERQLGLSVKIRSKEGEPLSVLQSKSTFTENKSYVKYLFRNIFIYTNKKKELPKKVLHKFKNLNLKRLKHFIVMTKINNNYIIWLNSSSKKQIKKLISKLQKKKTLRPKASLMTL